MAQSLKMYPAKWQDMFQKPKKINTALLFLLIISNLNAQQDTVILKNGLHQPGHIYKMVDNKIYLANGKDSVVYTAEDVSTLMFCHSVRSNNDCGSAGKSNGGLVKSFNNISHTTSRSNAPFADGFATFICTSCGGSGRIEIINRASPGIVIDQFLVTLNAGESYFTYTAHLPEGNYDWRYCDTEHNSKKGTFIIQKGSELRIALANPH